MGPTAKLRSLQLLQSLAFAIVKQRGVSTSPCSREQKFLRARNKNLILTSFYRAIASARNGSLPGAKMRIFSL
jgi:hypothetical protein